MFKKLLVALLALTMLIGLLSPALATNTKTIESLEQAIPLGDKPARSSPGCTYLMDEYYYTAYNNIIRIPNAYGDDFLNMRMTNGVAIELEYLECTFYQPYSNDGVGVTIYAWQSQAGYPDLSQVIYSAPVPVIDWSPPGNFAFIGVAVPTMPAFSGDFHVGFSPIVNVAGQRLGILADNGQGASGRSSFNEDGVWYPISDPVMGWGVDMALCIDAYKCATPDPACPSSVNATDQWPVWCHDFGRSSQSGIQLGTDISGIANAWVYDLGDATPRQIARTSPLIVDDKVYVIYLDRVVCLNLLTGAPIWSSKDQTWNPAISASLLSNPCIEGGFLYMGTGATVAGGPAGFMKIDAATGALVWGRGAGLPGGNLEGTATTTAIATPVIIGGKVIFGTQGGIVYALDKLTGVTLYSMVLPTEAGLTAKLMGSISSDGTNVFIGTASATALPIAGGRVYSFLPGVASFTQNWVYNQTAAMLAAYPGGFWSAPSYRNGNLFINSVGAYSTVTGYSGYRQDLDPATGIQKWYADVLMGGARNAPAATICNGAGVTAVFANYNTAGYAGVFGRGIRAVNTFNSTLWSNLGNDGEYENQVYCSPTVTSDLSPWVFYGTADPYGQNALKPVGGFWKIVNGTTGVTYAEYALSGMVNGTAIAHGSDGNDYIVVTTQLQYNTNVVVVGSGLVLAFRDQGPRPRLVVPASYVEFPSTNDAEATPVQRTAVGAITNTGSAPLTYTTTLSDGLVFAKVRTVPLSDQELAANLAAGLIDRTIDDMSAVNIPVGNKALLSSLVQNEEGDWYMPAKEQIKPAMANSARLGVPTWVTWVSGENDPLGIPSGGSADFTFQFDLTQMNKLGVNIFYVQLSTNDPDYNAEIGSPQGVQAEIAYSMPYRYCATNIVEGLYFGDVGVMWANNIGLLGHGDYADEFAPTGAGDIMFAGTMFYANDMASAAWNPVAGDGSWDALTDGSFLYGYYPTGTDCGGCVTNTTLPARYAPSYANLMGDVCTFAMVDSGQDMGYYPNQDGPSMGLLIKSKEIGIYGADFGAFKLTVQTIINRSATTPINGLYYGAFVDWDVSGADVGAGDAAKGYIYQYGDGAAYGFIGLPSAGSYWPDGVKTDPMYNGTILHSSDDYWDNEQFDSLYAWVNENPEGNIKIRPVETAGTDRAMELAFGKTNLAGSGQHKFGFATFGIASGFTGPTQIDALRKLANKLAGFGRGDVDNNEVIDLRDLVRLNQFVHDVPGTGAMFLHTHDVDNSGGTGDPADVAYLAAYFFTGGPPPKSAFVF